MAVSYMTEEGYNKILAEINYLETVKRPEISAQIAEARDKGDLSENAEYDAAKEAQGIMEAKLAQLKGLIANARLIENIFFKNSPLHDGAMIIVDNDIRAAGCILPVSNDPNLSKDLGLRHRSALGLSQATDCLVIVISEERGKISLAQNGVIDVDVDIDTLRQRLDAIYAS